MSFDASSFGLDFMVQNFDTFATFHIIHVCGLSCLQPPIASASALYSLHFYSPFYCSLYPAKESSSKFCVLEDFWHLFNVLHLPDDSAVRMKSVSARFSSICRRRAFDILPLPIHRHFLNVRGGIDDGCQELHHVESGKSSISVYADMSSMMISARRSRD